VLLQFVDACILSGLTSITNRVFAIALDLKYNVGNATGKLWALSKCLPFAFGKSHTKMRSSLGGVLGL
jgi:hypothetical protein